MNDGEELTVSEDPDLHPEEKQLSFVTTKAAEEFHVHSEVASITRWLLDHPAFDEQSRRERDGEIHAVTGRIPIGMLDLKGRPRNSNQFSRVLSSATKREQAEEREE